MEILKKHKEIILYLIFGGLTVAINLTTYILLTRIANINYLIANIMSWFIAVLFAYLTNKIYVFESNLTELIFLIKELISFVSCRLFSGILELILMYLMINILYINDLFVKIFTNTIIILLNYILSKAIIFNKQSL